MILTKNSDLYGAFASGLCLIHCVATPFLFMAGPSTIHMDELSPWWWGILDYLFIGIAFLAVYRSAQTTSLQWMKYALYISWVAMSLILLNEKFEVAHLMEEVIYIPAVALVVLHLYNRKHCKCATDHCCSNP